MTDKRSVFLGNKGVYRYVNLDESTFSVLFQ